MDPLARPAPGRPDAALESGADKVLHVQALRGVHRALGELRRGTPVLLRGPDGNGLLVGAAETLSGRGLADFVPGPMPGDGEPPVLLLEATRAAAILDTDPDTVSYTHLTLPTKRIV